MDRPSWTFRDPDGVCLRTAQGCFRFVSSDAADRVAGLLASSTIQELIERGALPQTRVLTREAVAALFSNSDLGYVEALLPRGLVLEHELIEFPSFPHEWCPQMLYAAGELTLDIQLRALQDGLTLKDATPTNVLFRSHQPVFVDLLSFMPREPGMAVWVAYAQFVRTFLLPLMLYRKQGVPPHEVFLSRRDGLEPEEVYRRLSMLSRLTPVAMQYATLPSLLGRLRASQTVSPQQARKHQPERAAIVARMLVKSLYSALRRVRPRERQGSVWSNYMETRSYGKGAFAAKEDFVRLALVELAPDRVLDIGCNTGHFSLIAAGLGASVVSVDYDPVVVGQVWSRSRAENARILPLVVNLARPSPGLGWRNLEQESFLSRARGRFDAALLLAVIHHLTVTDGIPLADVLCLVAELVTKGAVVEYVPAEDPMFQRIVRNKEHLIPRLQRPAFEAALAPWFDQVRTQELPGSGRVLYLLRKKGEVAV